MKHSNLSDCKASTICGFGVACNEAALDSVKLTNFEPVIQRD